MQNKKIEKKKNYAQRRRREKKKKEVTCKAENPVVETTGREDLTAFKALLKQHIFMTCLI